MADNYDELWDEVFTNPKSSMYRVTKLQATTFKRFGSDPRCKVCQVPLSNRRVATMFKKQQSALNPRMCTSCETWVADHSPGGTDVYMSVLFADVRGSTSLAEEVGATEFSRRMTEFYEVGASVIADGDGMVDTPTGDEVRGWFLPFFTPEHSTAAIHAGLAMIEATKEVAPVGVGVHTGVCHVSSTKLRGGEGADITALGDPVNVTARLSSNALAGELLVSRDALKESGLDLDGKPQSIKVKGRDEAVDVIRISST